MDLTVDGFDRDQGNWPKCGKHGVPCADIEALFESGPAVYPDPGHSRSEERMLAIGRSGMGRFVLVAFTLRRSGHETLIRPSAPATCTRERLSTMSDNDKLKPPPRLSTDEEAERFVNEADLTEYDLSHFTPVQFEFQKKTARINMRLPEPLLDAIKAKAKARGIPYQRFIREAIERAAADR